MRARHCHRKSLLVGSIGLLVGAGLWWGVRALPESPGERTGALDAATDLAAAGIQARRVARFAGARRALLRAPLRAAFDPEVAAFLSLLDVLSRGPDACPERGAARPVAAQVACALWRGDGAGAVAAAARLPDARQRSAMQAIALRLARALEAVCPGDAPGGPSHGRHRRHVEGAS